MNDKYRWHDLLANPEELPEYDATIITAWELPSKKLYYSLQMTREDIDTSLIRNREDVTCLAWRYLEPFGGDEA